MDHLPRWLQRLESGISRANLSSSSGADTSEASWLSAFPVDAETSNYGLDLTWYRGWLDQQQKQVPSTIAERIRSVDEAFQQVAELVRTGLSIDDIATKLSDSGCITIRPGDNDSNASKMIVFTMIGWQTMLYQAAFRTCPPEQLAVVDVTDGYNCQAFWRTKQEQSQTSLRLAYFLLGFGLMLPKRNICVSEDSADLNAFEEIQFVSPKTFNAALLRSLAHIKIKWIDVIGPHLEFDKASNTLYLFQYPSFCLANLSSKTGKPGVVHCCALPDDDAWANEKDIHQLLHEIVLSYRLLFGQSKKSRLLFQAINPFRSVPPDACDSLLHQLCAKKLDSLPSTFVERELYQLDRDFPVLRSRIATVQGHLSKLEPRGLRGIWRDKRNSVQWLTFWAVIVIGGGSFLLTVVQVALQAVQIAREA